MVQLVNPFSLLAFEEKPEASLLAAEKKEKGEKKEKLKKQRPRRRPVSSAPKSNSNGDSVKSSDGSQNQPKSPADSVSVSSSTSLNDVDQTHADHDAEGWQLVQHRYQSRKKGPRSGNQPQTREKQGAPEKQGAIGNNHVDVEEGIKQLQEVAKGMNGSQGVKPRKPNINGSARRRLQKKKDAGAGQDQQVQATKEAAAADATEAAPAEKKLLTVTYTLEEFEKMKKNGHSNKSEEQPHQSAEKDRSFKGKDNGFKGKDNNFKGRRNQKGGNSFNGDIKDVSGATEEEKAAEILFTLNLGEFPVLGKAL